MKVQSFENRVVAIAKALRKVSPADMSSGIPRTGKDDPLDRLVEAIDDFLRRSHESAGVFQSAQELLRKPLSDEGLQLTEELMEALDENIPDTIYFKDTQSRFIHLSKAHLSAFHLTDKRDVIGKTDFDFFTEEHARQAFEDEQRIIRTGEPIINKEEKETWADRPPTWVLTTKMPLRDSHGKIVGTFGISRDITGRKRVEEALRRSEERYHVLFNCINDAVFVHGLGSDGAPGTITEVNDIACERLGYSRDDLLRMTPYDLFTADSAPIVTEVMGRLTSTKHAVWECTQVGRSGTRIPVEMSSHLFDLSGEPTVLSTARDITRRRLLEETLEREKALLVTLIDNLPDYVSVKDTESRVLITNAANARVMGAARPQDVVGKTDHDFYPAEEAARYLADERTVMATGTALINKEEESTDPEHCRRWTLTTKVPLRDAQGRIIGIACTGRDITERKQAEERIHDLARFTDESPNPVMRVSVEGSILYANESARTLLASWAGTPGTSVPAGLMPELLLAWKADEKRETETRDGENVIELTITPIRSRGYINLYGRDITEERSLAEKFLQVQKMEAVGRLAGGISHDFNNLLTVIGGYCALAQEEMPAGSPGRTQVDEIARATKQAANLTARLLAFSRKQVLMPRVIDLNNLLRAEQDIIARLAGEDIQLRMVLQPDAGNIRADPGQIEQVLMNLVVNARDAMSGGGRLTIETSCQLFDEEYASTLPGVRPGSYVRITVTDTGHGMDRDVLSHVFEPFFTTKEPSKGTGLGLSTVYGIVKQSDGAITCASEPGKGTTFTVSFPRSMEPAEPAAAPLADAGELRGTETILLVEDDDMVRRLTRTMLESSGYRVITAPGGKAALALMGSHGEVDLVVTDVVMPQMNGRELAKRLSVARPTLKVLYISGYAESAMTPRGTLDPGVDFI
ncbi:MAG TPA: PAS domain-containing protein, partial [Spirochaetia bacterium]|nr:PAS domain-containing protein [Spirochaetia bacterium]